MPHKLSICYQSYEDLQTLWGLDEAWQKAIEIVDFYKPDLDYCRADRIAMAEEWMEEYLVKYGLHDWSYAISYQDRDKWLGRCNHYHRCIILHYLHILESQETDILDTIWHEIAHALTPDDSITYPKTAGHGLIWIRKAQELGVSAKQLKYYQEKLAIA